MFIVISIVIVVVIFVDSYTFLVIHFLAPKNGL